MKTPLLPPLLPPILLPTKDMNQNTAARELDDNDMPTGLEEYSTSQKMHELLVCDESMSNETRKTERRSLTKSTDARETYYLTFGEYYVSPKMQMQESSLDKTKEVALDKTEEVALDKTEEKECRKQRRKEKNRQSAALHRKRKAEQWDLQQEHIKLLQAQLATTNVPAMPEQTVSDSNEGPDMLEVQILNIHKRFKQDTEKLKELESEKKKFEHDFITQVAKCSLLDQQNEELMNNNEDLEKENEELKEKVKELEAQTEVYKKRADALEAKIRKMGALLMDQ